MSAPVILMAPGAGATSCSEWMQRFARYLSAIGRVETVDYPYQLAGRKYPDRLPVLMSAHRDAVVRCRQQYEGPLVLVGKSMGSRVGCHVSLAEPVTALVCLGYPLLGAGNPNKRRDEVLRELRTPVLFVQGTRDPLCPIPALQSLLPTLKASTELHVVEDGDHSLQVTRSYLKRKQTTQEAVELSIVAAIERFVESTVQRLLDQPSSGR